MLRTVNAEAAAREEPAFEGPPCPDSRAQTLFGIRVLVVDDDDDARELTGAILCQRGALVTLAADVPSALRALDVSPTDVIVSDIAMPGADGYALARAVRARSSTPTTRSPALVAMTGFSAPDEVQRATRAGFDRHLAKPIEATELITAVRDAARALER